MTINSSDLISLVSLIVALVALGTSIKNLRVADQAARNDVLAQVRDWGSDVIDMLSEADGLCRLDSNQLLGDEFFLRRSALVSRASSLWDRGRCFFPNTYPELYGAHKPGAFQGLRPQILDLLALSHGLVVNIEYGKIDLRDEMKQALIAIRREFVSTIQKATSFSAPKSVRSYEIYLSSISVAPLPKKILALADAEKKGFELKFTEQEILANRH